MYVMKLNTIPRKALWGHKKVSDYFNYEYEEGVGQSWSFSMQKEGSNIIVNGEYKGKTLFELWEEKPELFHSRFKRFPVLIGMVGPEDALSIQVHPDAVYAKAHGLPSGKNEAWYFVDADKGADLIFGHHAADVEELKACKDAASWEAIINRIPVKQGDFVYVPAGMLHAMQKGVIAYEVQEATDITYRLYDYDRLDASGQKRTLDPEGFDCVRMRIPSSEFKIHPIVKEKNGYVETEFINSESFRIRKLEVKKIAVYPCDRYLLISVVKGSCTIDDVPLTSGQSVFVPDGMKEITIKGTADIMITSEGDV